MAEHCDCCVLRLRFGQRRKRILLLLTHHPELDEETFVGQFVAETDHGGRARGAVMPKYLLRPIEIPTQDSQDGVSSNHGCRRGRPG